MTLAALLSLLIQIAKAVPAFDSILQQANAAMVEHRRNKANTQTDEDRARITGSPWRCPATCPHRLQHDGTEQPAAPARQP
ncbi:MAG TPA: hypothetical protein VK961_15210 [Chthoniobacter sp.]|nr:hypothetical protein [Chthoniobacter sp.]